MARPKCMRCPEEGSLQIDGSFIAPFCPACWKDWISSPERAAIAGALMAFVGKWAPPPREETAEERNERITKEILSQPGYQKGMRKS